MKRTAEKYDLTRGVKLNHRLIHAKFDEDKSLWNLKIRHGDEVIEDTCDILVSANGHLSKWTWPSIVGLHSFRGDLIHSAEWSDDIDYTGKRVAVIGNGSSAIQIVPQMTKVASQVTNFIRAATWIIPGLGSKIIDGKTNYVYSEEEKTRFREQPEVLKAYRKKIQQQSNMLFSVVSLARESTSSFANHSQQY
jgi:cation diffusion facilitator CzcD-associated flavoprotein CzcO